MKIVDRHGDGHARGGPDGHKPGKRPFSERHRSGDLDRLTRGEIGRKVKLADQFRMMERGDVARRLGLHGHGTGHGHGHDQGHMRDHGHGHDHGRPPHAPNLFRPDHSRWHVDHHYRGPVSSRYVHGCFQFYYWGPSYFPSYCWYPRWSPWVDWCWHYRSHVLWDPRPLWCRPVVYVPAPRLIYYEVPVWAPLPAVECGTWVDVKRVVVGADYDLQLLAVRFVDPGHPEEQLGPRYRVWFRNNSESPLARPFDVFLVASQDEKLLANSPQAGVRVTSMQPGETQSVDVRLPFDAQAPGAAIPGGRAPLATLHVLVDANREVSERVETNNGVTLRREEILPVDPAAFELEPTAGTVGGEVVLAGEGFGPEPGQVLLHLGGIEMEAEILGWYDLGVRLVLPDLPLATPTEAELIVIRGDGAAANPLPITIAPRDRGSNALPLLNAPK